MNNMIDDSINPKFITKGFKKFPRYTDIYDEEGNYKINEENLQLLKNLAEIVVYKHFRNYINSQLEKEELEEVALVSMIERITEGKFDPTRGIIKNYLYTAARNGVTNYVYHFKNNNKEVISDTLPENILIQNNIKTITRKMINEFYKTLNKRYQVPINDLAWKLYKEGFPLNSELITSRIVYSSDYQLQKVFIKFLNYYKNII